jgi:prepilin-type N-terminal cleavage/methylation domain-containing protein
MIFPVKRTGERGFTLLEVAIVLVVVGLLGAGTLVIVNSLLVQERRQETAVYLDEVRQALLTYAALYKSVPTADTGTDGLPDAGQNAGDLPFKTLVARPLDAWGHELKYQVNLSLTDPATACTHLKDMIKGTPTAPAAWPKVWDEDGGAVAANPLSVGVVGVSAGPRDADGDGNPFDGGANGSNVGGAPYLRQRPDADFDDLVLYIGPATLYDWMKCN